MRTLILIAFFMVVTGCGATTDDTATDAATDTTTYDTEAPNTTGRPMLTIVGKSGLSLAGEDQVDGMFFGRFTTKAINYEKTSEQITIYNIGTAAPQGGPEPTCQTDLLKPSDAVAINFCGWENETRGNTFEVHVPNVDGLIFTSISDKPTSSVFSLDFLLMEIQEIGFVKDGTVYAREFLGGGGIIDGGSVFNNVLVHDLPQVAVTDIEYYVEILYARNDWFPVPFTLEVTRSPVTSTTTLSNGLSVNLLRVDISLDASISLTDEQKEILRRVADQAPIRRDWQQGGENSLSTIITKVDVIPMDLATLDVSSASPKALTNLGEQRPWDEVQLEGAEKNYAEMVAQELSYNPDWVDDRLETVAVPVEKSAEQIQCEEEDSTNIWDYQNNECYRFDSPADGSVPPPPPPPPPPSLWLTSTGIPLDQVKFEMTIDFSSILSPSSSLTNDESAKIEFNRINGRPFGASIKVN